MSNLCQPQFFHGVAEWTKTERGVRLSRIPSPFCDRYAEWGQSLSNVRFCVKTDAQELRIRYEIITALAGFNAFGLRIDGTPQPALPWLGDEAGEYEITVPLTGALCEAELYLPAFSSLCLIDIEAVGASIAQPIEKRGGVYYAFGDSITKGLGCLDPSMIYTETIARNLSLECMNFGGCGWQFDPETLSGLEQLPKPELVTVSFGVNDWDAGQRENMSSFLKNCAAYLKKIDELYHDIPTFVVLPLWCVEEQRSYKRGNLQNIRENIKRVADFYPHFQVIDGGTLIPHDPALLKDGVHPNDQGYALLGEALTQAIRERL